jgi:hypothetical protein
MLTLDFILTLLALACFVAAAAGVKSRINLTAAGLALWVVTLLV